jgi:hypothetical protein
VETQKFKAIYRAVIETYRDVKQDVWHTSSPRPKWGMRSMDCYDAFRSNFEDGLTYARLAKSTRKLSYAKQALDSFTNCQHIEALVDIAYARMENENVDN